MCTSNYNNDLCLGDLTALKDTVLADETFTFHHGEIGVITDFVPPRDCLAPGTPPHKVILRMLKYGGYRVPVLADLVVKLDIAGSNGDLIRYLQVLEESRKEN